MPRAKEQATSVFLLLLIDSTFRLCTTIITLSTFLLAFKEERTHSSARSTSLLVAVARRHYTTSLEKLRGRKGMGSPLGYSG